MVAFLVCPVQHQELDSMTLVGPFHPKMFHDSMKTAGFGYGPVVDFQQSSEIFMETHRRLPELAPACRFDQQRLVRNIKSQLKAN